MTVSSQKFQAREFQPPRGTRDFYPQDMAVRRYIENTWRQVSINHGFDEIEGPTFEHLELYTHKSGPAIASEIFHVFSGKGKDEDEAASVISGQAAPYALRPEFTPTLARMVAAKAAELPRPIKWFAIPSHFRAERPQRGRLREFMQWNVDFIGDDSPRADAEVIATAVAALGVLGLTSNDVQIRVSDRKVINTILLDRGVSNLEQQSQVCTLLDRRSKLSRDEFAWEAGRVGLTKEFVADLDKTIEFVKSHHYTVALPEMFPGDTDEQPQIFELMTVLEALKLQDWIRIDLGIVRGLAYYTGTVFEIHEAGGKERAIAGGGRYDNLIESFGGPSLPACGFGMGDVVLGNILNDKGLLKDEVILEPLRPDAFIIAADDSAAARLPRLVASLRGDNLHIRHSYKTTRNVGKLLGEASKARSRFAVILGKELAAPDNRVAIKNLESGEQREATLSDLPKLLKSRKNEQ